MRHKELLSALSCFVFGISLGDWRWGVADGATLWSGSCHLEFGARCHHRAVSDTITPGGSWALVTASIGLGTLHLYFG